MQTLKSLFVPQSSSRVVETQNYENFHSMAFTPMKAGEDQLDENAANEKAKQIFQWAIKNGAKYYTFFGYPQTQGVLQKQETLLDTSYHHDYTLKATGKSAFGFAQLGKGEGDGSSFPSGGLRKTQSARAYTVWDQKSEVFIRQKSNVLYIPALLVTHHGEALDDKTLFRKSEVKLEEATLTLLKKVGRNATAVTMALGLQQQFFVIPKQSYNKRIDLKSTGRALIGKLPPKHQQFSDHYYGKIPFIVEEALRAAEKQLLEMGVPCKTRHKEVAPNQFEFCPLYEDAGKAIDHNMMLMEVLKEAFDERGMTVLLHEKPFANMNGSGKHCNWSLNYVDENGDVQNLFKIPKKEKDILLFRLFVLVQLKALLNHSKLYLSAVGVPGNELRLGGHEAPPRIISAFLGQSVSEVLDKDDLHKRVNLKDQLPNLNYDILQEDTDRNRTSPYAYTGNKFEFRAVGSTQNPSFVMAVIAATFTKEINAINERLDKGEKIETIMAELLEETKAVRYSKNGYSPEWIEEAKKRGLYVNEKFFENVENFKKSGKVFVDIGVTKEAEVEAKFETMFAFYENTVKTQSSALQTIIGNQIIPRCYEFLRLVEPESKSARINKRSENFINLFEELVGEEQKLKELHQKAIELEAIAHLRSEVMKISELVNKILDFLPKKSSWPEFEDFMNSY